MRFLFSAAGAQQHFSGALPCSQLPRTAPVSARGGPSLVVVVVVMTGATTRIHDPAALGEGVVGQLAHLQIRGLSAAPTYPTGLGVEPRDRQLVLGAVQVERRPFEQPVAGRGGGTPAAISAAKTTKTADPRCACFSIGTSQSRRQRRVGQSSAVNTTDRRQEQIARSLEPRLPGSKAVALRGPRPRGLDRAGLSTAPDWGRTSTT